MSANGTTPHRRPPRTRPLVAARPEPAPVEAPEAPADITLVEDAPVVAAVPEEPEVEALAQRLLVDPEEIRLPLVGLLGDKQTFTRRTGELTWRDEFAAKRFLEVMHLVRPPTALFHPRVALRALFG